MFKNLYSQKSVMKINILLIFAVLFANIAFAAPLNYDVTVNGFIDQEPFTQTKNEVKDCENTCTYQLPIFDTPENFTFSDYLISTKQLEPWLLEQLLLHSCLYLEKKNYFFFHSHLQKLS